MSQPEESISIQHCIGADIIMQLDDVGQYCLSCLPPDHQLPRSTKFNRRASRWRINVAICSLA
jgi:queuine/archaeosine tRNA-ribosyltransferase